ncbi:hypothetical protein AVEN_47440-1, partial [Araneus ventricosus]
WRPRQPSGKTGAPEPEGFRLETRFHRRFTVLLNLLDAVSRVDQINPATGLLELGKGGAS